VPGFSNAFILYELDIIMVRRSQSAIEYLTTYGWAIVAVAVAIGVLYSLGVFGGAANGATGCTVISGFTCSKPLLYSSGILTLGFGQIGATKTITATGCTQNATAPTNWLSNGTTIQSGQVSNLTFSCSGIQSGAALGSIYTGTLWIQYTVSGGSGQTVTQQVGTIKLPVQAGGSPLHALAWVETNGGVIYIINTSSNMVVNTVTVGGTPTSIAFNPSGTLAYVTQYGAAIDVISTANYVQVGTISVSGGCTSIGQIAVNPSGTMAYTTCGTQTGYLGIVSLVSNTATSYAMQPQGGSPNYYQGVVSGVAFSPDGTYAYVTSTGVFAKSYLGALTVISTTTNSESNWNADARTTTGATQVAFSPTGSIAYVTSYNGIAWVTPGTTALHNFYPLNTSGVGHQFKLDEMGFNPSGTLAYVTEGIANSDNVLVINTATNAFAANIVLSGLTYGVTFNPSGTYAYVVLDVNPGIVDVINPSNGNVVATINNIGSFPNYIAIQPGT
jgi:DNA-binding beta-propeller fold protein YncE